MKPKLAPLPRILPGLFRRLPTVTSVGYLMPRSRCFFAGVSFSAALHAAVLCGFNAPHRPPTPVEPPETVLARRWFGPLPETLPPPPSVVNGEEEAKRTKANTEGEDVARFREPPPRPTPGAFVLDRIPFDGGKAPDKHNLRWEVPREVSSRGPAVTDDPFPLAALDKIPVVTSSPAPRYPFELKHAGLGGTVLLRFVVDSRGEVSDVEVVRADYPEFGVAAAEAMVKWRFKAGMKDGCRVSTRMEMPINFSLERGA
jgi:protein TonB